ncbi:hypothetical protein BD779DRAFT_851734 [Infundibulicybe gibba]|nr:hypothetical protein BD779DRAFT_851734 [Infundibulicybe gibba]
MSILTSLLSIVFTLLSLSVLGVQPTRLKKLVRHPTLFYYLCGTPSLFGGASALAFFLAVGSWTWLDEPAASRGWGPKAGALLLGVALVCNSSICLFLGASPAVHKDISDTTPPVTLPGPGEYTQP